MRTAASYRNDDGASGARYAGAVSEIVLAFIVIGVLLIADPDRLQVLIDRIRELSAWLAE